MRFAMILPALFVAILPRCSNAPTDPQSTGVLTVSLTDAPSTFEEVNITFSEISAHIDKAWVTVAGDPTTVNLLEWNNGSSVVLGTAEVPSGHYTQIRLILDAAEVLVDGETHPVTVPSGARTGLKLGPGFTVEEGSTCELIVDFDAHRFIVQTGPPGNPNRYLLKPTLRVVPLATTGSVSGTVTNPQHLPLAYAISGTDTVTATAVDTSSGGFRLAFLPGGTYDVAIQDTLGLKLPYDNAQVVPGADTSLGTLTLQ